MDARTTIDNRAASIGDVQIRQLVDTYPETMKVFDQYGMDMCCGGGHTVAEAARLHGLDPDTVVAQVADAIQTQHDQS